MPLPRTAVVLVAMILSGGACGDSPVDVDLSADLIGVVYAVHAASGGATGQGSVWLEDVKPELDGHPDSVGIVVTDGTEILARTGAPNPLPATLADIAVGQTLRVWHGPHELRSLPPQRIGIRLEIMTDGVELYTTASEYSAGDTIELVLANRSDHAVGYNLCVAELERRADGWEHVDRRPGGAVCTMELRILRPDQRATTRQPVFEWMEPGDYRFRVAIEHPLGEGRVEVTSPVFRIRAAGQ